MNRIAGRIVLVASLLAVTHDVAAENESSLWQALRSGDHVALLRHAIAPGSGDPPQFALGDCSTQRNLSEAGREQARRIGARFRENGIENAEVLSSQWCRCIETATLLGLGPIGEQPVLNSFFQQYERRDPQTEQLQQLIAGRDLSRPLVMVTHQVNITALTNVYPGSGDLVVIRREENGRISVVGTIRTD